MTRHDRVETYADGEIICREGDSGRDLYIVQDGRVEVVKQVADRNVRLSMLDRGAFFGEMSLLEGLPRNATVRAVGTVRVAVVEPGSLLLKIRRDPTFAFEMLQHMSRRIRELDDRVVALLAAEAPDNAPEASGR